MLKDNRIVVDLKKVQWAKFVWENQWGQKKPLKPIVPTVRGEYVSHSELAEFHRDYPIESMFERAKRLDLLDTWEKFCYLKLQANTILVYTGDKAQSVYDAFCAQVFSKRRKK